MKLIELNEREILNEGYILNRKELFHTEVCQNLWEKYPETIKEQLKKWIAFIIINDNNNGPHALSTYFDIFGFSDTIPSEDGKSQIDLTSIIPNDFGEGKILNELIRSDEKFEK